MPRLTNLGALRCLDANAWKVQIESAMKTAGGRISDAAKALDVSERQLFRWLAEPIFVNVKRAPTGVRRERQEVRKKGKAA